METTTTIPTTFTAQIDLSVLSATETAVILSAVKNNPLLACLADIMLTITPGGVTLQSCDLESHILKVLFQETDANGTFSVPLYPDIFKTLTKKGAGAVKIEYTHDDTGHWVKIGSQRYKGYDISDQWPSLPESDDMNNGTILGLDPAEITTLYKFVTKDQMRPAMCGVNITNQSAQASDGHKLISSEILESSGAHFEPFTLPPSKFWPKLKGTVAIRRHSKAYARLTTSDGTTIFSRVINQVYPDFRAVIPQNNKYFLRADRKELIQAITEVLKSANKTTKQIFIDIHADKAQIFTFDLDFDREASAEIQSETNRKNTRVAFNGDFLLSCLNTCRQDTAELTFSAESKPFLITDPGRTILCMPVIIYDQSENTAPIQEVTFEEVAP